MRFSIAIILATFVIAIVSCSEKKQKEEKEKETQMQEKQEITSPYYTMTVTRGDDILGNIEIELFPDVAPKHVANFDSLVAEKFYDGTTFHRVIPGFMIQGGCPNSKYHPTKPELWGRGDPNLKTVPAEFSDLKHERGVISAARGPNPNSATSQFFIVDKDSPHLDGQYTIFGKVIEGMDVVDSIVATPKRSLPSSREGATLPKERIEMKIVKKNKSE